MDTELCGKTAVLLGAGRETKESLIDAAAGIRFYKKTGEWVEKGEELAVLYSSSQKKLEDAVSYLEKGYTFGSKKPKELKQVFARVSRDGTLFL